jgi:hypothetical protein
MLTGCESRSLEQRETKFTSLLKDSRVQDVNRSITLTVESMNPSVFKPLGIINLTVKNHSSKTIMFPEDCNIQLFLFSDETKSWEVIKDAVKYYKEIDIEITPSEEGLDIYPVVIRPDFESNGKEQRLRAVVTGYVVDEDKVTNEPVSAFVDFKVKP